MPIRRCAVVFVELDQEPRFDFTTLLTGGDGLDRSVRWLAYAAHLEKPLPVTLAQLAVLEHTQRDGSVPLPQLIDQHGEGAVRALLEAGLLLDDAQADSPAQRLDATVRDVAWWPPALIAQSHGGWDGVDVQARNEAGLMLDTEQMLDAFGNAPEHEYRRAPEAPTQALAAPQRRDFDELLAKRMTCRNFDDRGSVSASDLATMLYRVFGAVGTYEIAPGAVAVKKNSPAGGGLHGTEAYVLVQRAEGLAPGLYHYLSLQHALEPLQPMNAEEAADLAHRCVAGQNWFANVPVMVIMTARFDRLFWKYRRHTKAWRVVHLDIGHLSQTMYLSAADLGLGAFVTAAINDRDIDPALGLTRLREGAIAIVGFGPRAAVKTTIELDNLTPTPASLLR